MPCCGCHFTFLSAEGACTIARCSGRLNAVSAAAAAEKLEQAEGQLSHAGRSFGALDRKPTSHDSQLLKVCRDSSKMSVEQVKGISSQVGSGLL